MTNARIYTAQVNKDEAELLILLREHKIDLKGLNRTINESIQEIKEMENLLKNILR